MLAEPGAWNLFKGQDGEGESRLYVRACFEREVSYLMVTR